MTKTILTVIVGVFVGAFALELMSRKRLPQKVRRVAADFSQAFSEGYHGEGSGNSA